MEPLSKLRNLEYLNLSFSLVTFEEGLEHLQQMLNLQELYLCCNSYYVVGNAISAEAFERLARIQEENDMVIMFSGDV